MAEKEALIDNWTIYWTNLKQCRQTKLFLPKPDQPLSKTRTEEFGDQLRQDIEVEEKMDII
jgi:hypothetical protein